MILNIDTATEHASVCISNNGQMQAIRESNNQKEHASFLHVAIRDMLDELGLKPAVIDAVAITSGPGSYTGLRVSMAAAKGWCYALKKPLISINTLEVMTYAAKEYLQQNMPEQGPVLLCPMLDARRMEVFTAIYDFDFNAFLKPGSLVLEPGVFKEWLSQPIFFFGNGSQKMKILSPEISDIIDFQTSSIHLGILSFDRFRNKEFSDVAYLEPAYLKEFYTTAKH